MLYFYLVWGMADSDFSSIRVLNQSSLSDHYNRSLYKYSFRSLQELAHKLFNPFTKHFLACDLIFLTTRFNCIPSLVPV